MAGVNYVPGFFPTPWQNGIDVVSASGDNGFNVRFQQLIAEFQKIADAPLEPGSVRSAHFELVTGSTVTNVDIANGANLDITGPVVTVAPPAPVLPLLSITCSTAGASFSVLPCYRTSNPGGQLISFFRVQNLGGNPGGTPIRVTATPYLLKG